METFMSSGDNAKDLSDFAAMSAALTGFTLAFVKPTLDPVNLAQAYFDEATSRTSQPGAPATVQTLLTAYRAIRTQPAQTIADTLLETGTRRTSNALLAQSIVLMWYIGSWYEPLVAGAAPPLNPPGEVQVVSSLAYTHGFAWNVMQSHPMGYSEFVFGYWSKSPGPLSEFGVDDAPGGGQ
jgi:hypothetical protein